MARRLVVEADGGSRGNPGRAGYGALVRDATTGEVLAERAQAIGFATNNVAEYGGLVAGLGAAEEIDRGAAVEVRMDSRLVVEQMSGRWQIKHEDMRRLARQARDVVRRIVAAGGSVTYTWVPRAANAAADALANAAMDGTADPLGRTRTAGGSTRPAVGGADVARSGIREGTARADGGDSGIREATPRLAGGREGARGTARAAAPQTPAEVPPEPTDPPGSGRPPLPAVRARVVLVRHGVTEFTVAGRLDGRGGPDPGLNDLGLRQAAAAGRAVREYLAGAAAAVVTSSLARAAQTGDAVAEALGVTAVRDADWDEQAFGDWDGWTFEELLSGVPDQVVAMREDPDYRVGRGESHHDLVKRVLAGYDRVVAAGGTTVVVAHRKPLLVVLAHLLGIPFDRIWVLATAPASLTAVEIADDGRASVAFVNDTAHLHRLGSPPGTLGG